MSDNDLFPTFDTTETYLMLIDSQLKQEREGVTYLCVNPSHDVWQSVDTVSFDTLKGLAIDCVGSRLKKGNFPPSCLDPEFLKLIEERGRNAA